MSDKQNDSFWVILENSEGRILKSWKVDMKGGIPFGMRLRVVVNEPNLGKSSEVSK